MTLDSLGDAATPPGILRGGTQRIVAPDGQALAARAAELFVTLAQRAADVEGARFTVALSGGGTPKALYRLLAVPPYVGQIPWERVHLFWGDERHVPPDDAESNYRMVREALLSKITIPAENVHRVRTEAPDAADVARDYADNIRGFFQLQPNQWPRFDLVLLGLGPDGHTASLFPGTDALHDTTGLVAAPWVEKFDAHRITLTAPVINNAAAVAFLVAGAAKAGVLRAVIEGPRDPDRLPAQLIAPTDGALLWMLDEAAAGSL
jgi:6-phosphogluconolactonase